MIISFMIYCYNWMISPRVRELGDNLHQIADEEEEILGGRSTARNDVGIDGETKQPLAQEEELEEEEEAFFFPLGYPSLEPGDYYTSYDREWHNFAAIAADGEELEATKSMLSLIFLRRPCQFLASN